MTTQIVLGNGYGLALATDSAVTVAGRRTYETSEKLILLGDAHPVAVLVSGSVTQFSLPIQVLLREWSKTLESGQLRKVADYRESFISWLRDNIDEFPEAERRLIDTFWSVDVYLHGCWRDSSGSDDYPTIAEKTEATFEYLRYWIDRHEGYDKLDRLSEIGGEAGCAKLIDELWSPREDYWVGLDSRINYWFDDVDSSALGEIKGLLKRLLVLRASTWELFGDTSNVVFAGFGSKEMVPAVASVRLMGGFKSWISSSSSIPNSASKIGVGYFLFERYGQTDYIDNILLGYRSELIESAVGVLQEAGAKVPSDSEDPQLSEGGREFVQDVSEQLWSAVTKGAEEQMLKPLRRAISAMPLRSLADAARSLVGVQALGKAISAELQTTGGRIEVALVSRADGVRVISE